MFTKVLAEVVVELHQNYRKIVALLLEVHQGAELSQEGLWVVVSLAAEDLQQSPPQLLVVLHPLSAPKQKIVEYD